MPARPAQMCPLTANSGMVKGLYGNVVPLITNTRSNNIENVPGDLGLDGQNVRQVDVSTPGDEVKLFSEFEVRWGFNGSNNGSPGAQTTLRLRCMRTQQSDGVSGETAIPIDGLVVSKPFDIWVSNGNSWAAQNRVAWTAFSFQMLDPDPPAGHYTYTLQFSTDHARGASAVRNRDAAATWD